MTQPLPPVEKLQAFPDEVFAREGTAVLFTAKATRPDAQLALIQIDEQGKPISYVGVLSDDKTRGDRVAHDQIFSLKMEIKGTRGTVLHFAVITDNGQINADTFSKFPPVNLATTSVLSHVKVVLRPTLVQIVRQIWARWRKPTAEKPDQVSF